MFKLGSLKVQFTSFGTKVELPSITVLFFRSISSAEVFPEGLAGAAVIGALVLLRVIFP